MLIDSGPNYLLKMMQSYLLRSKIALLGEEDIFRGVSTGYILGETFNRVLELLLNPKLDLDLDRYFSKIRKMLLVNFELIQLGLSDNLVHALRKMNQI